MTAPPEPWQRGGFGLYLHWPFCQAKCPYCDFNSHVVSRVDPDLWQTAFLAEIDRAAAETPGRVLSTVFFGGGTPSLMPASLVAAILDRIRDRWTCANDPEVTLEANPTSAEAERFRGYRAAGVNRLSLGVQALNDADLKALGRLHSAGEALAAVDMARGCFDRVSFDLIYGRQGQSVADWQRELGQALAFGPEHLSLYQLTIEPGTAFGDRFARGRLPGLPDEDLSADLWEVTQEMTTSAELPGYEVSNHAAPGAEARHNLVYWLSGDWVGLGPGAHGRVTLDGKRWATEAHRGPGDWLRHVRDFGSGESDRRALTPAEVFEERVMMGLRLSEGVALDDVVATAPNFDNFYKKFNGLKEIDLVKEAFGQLKVTGRGRPVLNGILRELLAG